MTDSRISGVQRILVICGLCGAGRGFMTNQEFNDPTSLSTYLATKPFRKTLLQKCQYAKTCHHDGTHDAFNCPKLGCGTIEKWLSEVEMMAVMNREEVMPMKNLHDEVA